MRFGDVYVRKRGHALIVRGQTGTYWTRRMCVYVWCTRAISPPLSVPPAFCTDGDNGMQYSHEPNPGVRGSCAFASKFISRRPQIRTDRPWFIPAQLIVISLSSRTKGRFGNVPFVAPPSSRHQPRRDKREFRLIEATTNYYNLACYVRLLGE